MNKILLIVAFLFAACVSPIPAHPPGPAAWSIDSFSWDAALFGIATGGYMRRRSWGNPGYYIYNPYFNHHPINLNKMKLYSCDLDQCANPPRYHPTKGDKTAGDWEPVAPIGMQ